MYYLAMNKQHWSLILIVTMALWATIYPLMATIRGAIDPLLLAFIRYALTVLVLAIPFALRPKTVLPTRADALRMSILGCLATFPTIFIFKGIENSSASVGTILVNTNPLFVAVLATLFAYEFLSLKRACALLVGIVGIVCTVLNGQSFAVLLEQLTGTGASYLLLAASLIALYTTFFKTFVQQYGGLTSTLFVAALGTVILGLLAFTQGSFSTVSHIAPSTYVVAATIGLVSTAIPFLLWHSSMKHLGVTAASSFKLLIPPFGVLYSVVFLGESLTVWILLGMALTSAGVWGVQKWS